MASNDMNSIFGSMYAETGETREPFGEHWCGPDVYEHGEDALVAAYDKIGSDGRRVLVYCCALPAQFWKIEALPYTDWEGNRQKGFTLSTGSGGREMAEWVHTTASMISEGMLNSRRDIG